MDNKDESVLPLKEEHRELINDVFKDGKEKVAQVLPDNTETVTINGKTYATGSITEKARLMLNDMNLIDEQINDFVTKQKIFELAKAALQNKFDEESKNFVEVTVTKSVKVTE